MTSKKFYDLILIIQHFTFLVSLEGVFMGLKSSNFLFLIIISLYFFFSEIKAQDSLYLVGTITGESTAIPVVAKMKIIIGNIKLELVNWKKEGWQPPKFVD